MWSPQNHGDIVSPSRQRYARIFVIVQDVLTILTPFRRYRAWDCGSFDLCTRWQKAQVLKAQLRYGLKYHIKRHVKWGGRLNLENAGRSLSIVPSFRLNELIVINQAKAPIWQSIVERKYKGNLLLSLYILACIFLRKSISFKFSADSVADVAQFTQKGHTSQWPQDPW